MSCNVGELVACPAIQETLNDQFGGINGNFTSIGAPLIEVLTSPTNTNNVIQRQIDSGNGHYRDVQIRYESRYRPESVSTSAVLSCTGGNNPCNDSYTYSIDPSVGVSMKWSFELNEIAAQCEEDASWVARQVMRGIDACRRKMDITCATTAATLVGKFASTGSTAAVSGSTKNADNYYIPDLVEKVRYESYMNENASGLILIGGGQLFYNYFTAQVGQVPNTAQGIDMPAMIAAKGMMPFFDFNMNGALSSPNKFLAFVPGALQLLTYNEYRGASGIRTFSDGSQSLGVVVDPVTGLAFDYFAKFDCGTWNFQVKLAYKLVGLPTDLFFSGDRLDGYTGVNQFVIAN